MHCKPTVHQGGAFLLRLEPGAACDVRQCEQRSWWMSSITGKCPEAGLAQGLEVVGFGRWRWLWRGVGLCRLDTVEFGATRT